jgi:hypothetical protein
MAQSSNDLDWEKSNAELDNLKNCLIYLHKIPKDTMEEIKNKLLSLIREKCVTIHLERIKLNVERFK